MGGGDLTKSLAGPIIYTLVIDDPSKISLRVEYKELLDKVLTLIEPRFK